MSFELNICPYKFFQLKLFKTFKLGVLFLPFINILFELKQQHKGAFISLKSPF